MLAVHAQIQDLGAFVSVSFLLWLVHSAGVEATYVWWEISANTEFVGAPRRRLQLVAFVVPLRQCELRRCLHVET